MIWLSSKKKKHSDKQFSKKFQRMYSNTWQKPYSPGQSSIIHLEQSACKEPMQEEILVYKMSETITNKFMPIYDNHQIQNGKVLNCYPILKFNSNYTEAKVQRQKKYDFGQDINIESYNNHFQMPNLYQPKQKPSNKMMNQRKIHQLLDQGESRGSFNDQDMYSNSMHYESNKNDQIKKLQQARKKYEKMAQKFNHKKIRRKNKDKNRPKKAKSGYNLFVQDVVPQIKAQNPSFSAPDLVRVAAKMYNKLTEAQKAPYQQRYQLDKIRFERQRQAYFKLNPQMDYRLDTKQKAMLMNGKKYQTYM